jgi:hypothetical protein
MYWQERRLIKRWQARLRNWRDGDAFRAEAPADKATAKAIINRFMEAIR